MAVRLVCFSGRVADFNHGRAQVPAIQLRQGMGERELEGSLQGPD